jgi:hypothetical protein
MVFAKNPLGVFLGCGGVWLGRPGPSWDAAREGEREREVGCGPGEREEASPFIFFWFSFLFSTSIFKSVLNFV